MATAHSLTDPSVEILDRLVAFDTVSSRPNVELIEWAANHLDALGYRCRIQRTASAEHANLLASIGPDEAGGLVLAGHSDVVPVDGQAWSTDPFKLVRDGQRLQARGSADMKGFIACVLASAPVFARPGLRKPVHVVLSYNEETNMQGIQDLTGIIKDPGIAPAACIIGEPTLMQVVVANKGAAIFDCHVRGFPVHSSLRDKGISAVEIAAEIISWLNARQKRLLDEGRHDGFAFPHTSIHAGMIHGGTAHNITAQDCRFKFEIRALPGFDAGHIVDELQRYCRAELLPAMQAVNPDCNIRIDQVVNSPGLDETTNRHLAQAIMPLCNCLTPGRVSFGTEAGFMTQAGVPTVVCGPGDIGVAHMPDEYVEVGQLGLCLSFLDTLDNRLRQSPLL